MANASWVTQSQAVVYGRAAILSAVVVSTSAGAAHAILYEGRDDTGRVIAEVRVPADSTQEIVFPDGLPVEDGLYVKLISNVQGVLIIWRMWEEVGAR